MYSIMRKLILLICFYPLLADAQKQIPRFENDTLFTSSGYKIYPGLVLHFGKGTAPDKKFKFVRFIGVCCEQKNLTNNTVTVIKLSDYSVSGLGTGYIKVKGSMVFPEGDELKIKFNMAFDYAIEGMGAIPPELIVPEEFRIKVKQSASDEISKLYRLYQDSVITREEFESQKKKLLEH